MKKEVILLILVLMLMGCSSKTPVINKSFESLNYEVTECNDNLQEEINITTENNIQIKQIVNVNCCFEIELSYKETDGVLRIYEDFTGEECDCYCKKEINAEISDNGINEVEFYSRKDREYPYDLLLEQKI
jgi:hypothetical protein